MQIALSAQNTKFARTIVALTHKATGIATRSRIASEINQLTMVQSDPTVHAKRKFGIMGRDKSRNA